MSSVYFFLVAEASAISSAPNTMSRGTFFSRARTSTSITSSRFPAATALTATLTSRNVPVSKLRYQLRPIHVAQREPHGAAPFELQGHLARLGAAQHANEPAPARLVGRAHAHLRFLASEAREVGFLAQRPVQARRGDLQPLVIDPLDGQDARQMPARGRAVIERHAPGLIDEKA